MIKSRVLGVASVCLCLSTPESEFETNLSLRELAAKHQGREDVAQGESPALHVQGCGFQSSNARVKIKKHEAASSQCHDGHEVYTRSFK